MEWTAARNRIQEISQKRTKGPLNLRETSVHLIAIKWGLTALRGCGWQHAAASDLLPPQANLLLELLDLTVAVFLLLTLLLPMPQVVLHQLNGSNEGLRNAEMGILLQKAEKHGSEQR